MLVNSGNISPLTICTRDGVLYPPHRSINSARRTPFSQNLSEFTVLDIEPSGPVRRKWVPTDSDAEVVSSGGFRSGVGGAVDGLCQISLDQIYHTRTHLWMHRNPREHLLVQIPSTYDRIRKASDNCRIMKDQSAGQSKTPRIRDVAAERHIPGI
jgi:hypothetical protein